ncbi:hypothetical protein J5X84_36320 [Streptosporangiaceae bacterium NEAU-GS5]|nr:hypothetical protein [Streptosporangiaceae bacterium NEAU-GS5]
MNLHPADPYTWTRIVRRCQLAATVKAVAHVLADYASRDGRDVRPGIDLLIGDTGLSKSTVIRALKRLRALGLIDRVVEGSKNGRRAIADEYRLTFPDDLSDRVRMRGPDGSAPTGSGVNPNPDETGSSVNVTPDPAPGPVDNSGSGVTQTRDEAPPGPLPASNQVSHVLGTGVTRTPIRCHTDTPPTKHLPDTYQHTSFSPYGAEVEGEDHRPAPVDNPNDHPPPRPTYRQSPLMAVVPSADTEYDTARTELAALGPDALDTWLAKAHAELGPDATSRQLVLHAHHLALERRPA